MSQSCQFLTCEILVDSLFASFSDFETSVVQSMLSYRDLSEKVDSLQTAILIFKSSMLKTLTQRVGELLSAAHCTVDHQEFESFKERELTQLSFRLQQNEKRRCMHQLRNLLRAKMSHAGRALNESYYTLSPADLHTEETKLSLIASSIKLMEKDLGIEADDEAASKLLLPPRSPANDRFVSRFEESVVHTEHDDSGIFARKSFLTCSVSSLPKPSNCNAMDSLKLIGILQRKYTDNARVFFENANMKPAKKVGASSKVTVVDHIKPRPKSKDKVATELPKQEVKSGMKGAQKQKQPASSSKQKSNKDGEHQKSRRTIKLPPEQGIFLNILKESYEDFAKQTSSERKQLLPEKFNK